MSRRDEWIRNRWGAWLRTCIQRDNTVTLRGINRHLSTLRRGDYRGALRDFCAGQRTVSPDFAFAIGEAIALSSPCSWISGPYALAIAGYYEELLSFVECARDKFDEHWPDAAALFAIHVPYAAEFEIAKIEGRAKLFVSAANEPKEKAIRDVLRALRHASKFLISFGSMRSSISLQGSDPEALLPVLACWRARNGKRSHPIEDPTGSDRCLTVEAARRLSEVHGLDPSRLKSVLLNMLFEWIDLDFSAYAVPTARFQMETLRSYSRVLSEARHEEKHTGHYVKAELWPGGFITLPVTHDALNLPVADRLNHLKEYADASRQITLEGIRAGFIIRNHLDGVRDFAAQQMRRFMDVVPLNKAAD